MALYTIDGVEIEGIGSSSGASVSELQRRFKGKNIVWLGDSIHDYEQPDGVNIPYLFQYHSGCKSWNWAQGGTTMAKNGVANYDPYSGVGMVDAIISRNFTEQKKYQDDRNFVQQVSEMESFNFADAYACIIEFGTNDGWKQVPVGTPNEGFDVNTTAGALRYMIKELQTKYPGLKIAVCTTQPGVGFSDAEQQHPYDLKTQSDAIRDVCRNLFVPCIDIYHLLGYNEWTKDYLTTDGTHRSHEGKIKQVQIIENQMCLYD